MAKWETVTTLPQYHKPLALWFQQGQGLVLGQYWSLDQMLDSDARKSRASKEAVILRGEGDFKNWRKVYSGKGEMRSVSSPAPGIFFALGVSQDEEGNKQAFLVTSTDHGRTWTALPPPPISATGVSFHSPTQGYAWSVERLYLTLDGGQRWRDAEFPLQLLDGLPPPAVDTKGKVWMVGEEEIRSLDLTGARTAVPLPEGFRADILTLDTEGRPWLAGCSPDDDGERGPLELLSLAADGRVLQRRSLFPKPILLPEHLHVDRDTILLMASEIEATPPVSELHVSTDGGRKWKREEPEVTRGISAVFFEADGTVWTSGSADRLQRRRP